MDSSTSLRMIKAPNTVIGTEQQRPFSLQELEAHDRPSGAHYDVACAYPVSRIPHPVSVMPPHVVAATHTT
jgi:hypothetical protein